MSKVPAYVFVLALLSHVKTYRKLSLNTHSAISTKYRYKNSAKINKRILSESIWSMDFITKSVAYFLFFVNCVLLTLNISKIYITLVYVHVHVSPPESP